MRTRLGSARWTLTVAMGVAVVVAGAAVLWLAWPNSEPTPPDTRPTPGPSASASPANAPEPVDIGEPVRLTIEAIAVDAPIIGLGFAADGSQAVPNTLHETGWWRLGSRPGGSGNGVIVGHAASRADGVFDDLHTLTPGDEVTVTSEDGTARFTVTRTTETPVEDFAAVSANVYREFGRPGLVLMTCGGWNGEAYETTTIVYATLAG